MQRITLNPRKDWEKIVEGQGLTFHSRPIPYWNESATYAFSMQEIDMIEDAATEVHGICQEAARQIIKKNLFSRLGIGEHAEHLIRGSAFLREPQLYGRFDFAYDGSSPPKMLEYNADTPTSLAESAVAQWFWLKDVFPERDQFNSLHESLVDRWKELGIEEKLYFTAYPGIEEDFITTEYLRDTAHQAGLETAFIGLQEIGYNGKNFVDAEQHQIKNLFKLHPWEVMVNEPFGQYMSVQTRFIEPAWKMLWSNKGLLPILWQIAPNHPNLLESSFEELNGTYVKKPLFGREGQNVSIHNEGKTIVEAQGIYGEEGYVYQRFQPTKAFDERYPVLGVWMVGDKCHGMGIRETKGLITNNQSFFVPHYID